MPHYKFVEEHSKCREKEIIQAGRRVNLSEYITKKLNYRKVLNGFLEGRYFYLSLFAKFLIGGSHIENGVYLGGGIVRNKLNRKDKGVLGCNFSLYKTDLLKLNGFDERYLAPAVGEDSDLEWRWREYGFKVKSIKHLAIQYHLYHNKLVRDSENLKMFEEIKLKRELVTPYGIMK